MFDITADEISQLDDTDLRELVGRLCEAELVSLGLSSSAVTWGGNQTAADGGLDVRVSLPVGVSVQGFIPRALTGFQVKKSGMPRARILQEMRPDGVIRPVIQDIAGQAGAYVIVSSAESTADRALTNRQNGLREALSDVSLADQLHTDFYDRARLATWVRCHYGVIAWVKVKIGRPIDGWHSYGQWSGSSEDIDAEYLFDDKLRLHLGQHRDTPAKPVSDAIDAFRDELAVPGKIVRLVGLSGVGKTRLVQALFDARIGVRPLAPSLALYTNLSDNPNPQPISLASDLIAIRKRAILIVDNCAPDLHRRLSELCIGQDSTVSILTVEYDVREDQPEGTQVITLDTSSPDLIEKLIRRRYSHISEVDARTIAEAAGGNARIAIAIAETVERSDTVAGLSNEELFQRLFRQRHDPDDALLLAAQACSLVYSFQGDATKEGNAELSLLAALAGQTATEVYRHISELIRRNLVQQRGVWRAVLPHAIANRLAAHALQDIPFHLIDQQLLGDGNERLARSFSRRLSFLHDQPGAIAVVETWLAPDGLLGKIGELNELGQAMFENVAPVVPQAALAGLERAANSADDGDANVLRRNRSLLRSIAYDPLLFERSVRLLICAVMRSRDDRHVKEASDTFSSLFTIYFSGTHATIEQRLSVIDALLRSKDAKLGSLGLVALEKVLETMNFGTSYRFQFGARSRDYGYQPRNNLDFQQWYGTALLFIERLALSDGVLKPELRGLLAKKFRGLWSQAQMDTELERLSQKFAAEGFWVDGWAMCRQTKQFDNELLTPESASRLSLLEAQLRPSSLRDRVRAVVIGGSAGKSGLDDVDDDGDFVAAYERMEAEAAKLGATVALDVSLFSEILSDILRGGIRVWAFGMGLASASADRSATWTTLVDGLTQLTQNQRDPQGLGGFLAEVSKQDSDLAQHLLDLALDQPVMSPFLPMFHSAVGLNERGVERLKKSLIKKTTPVSAYQHLALGGATAHVAGGMLSGLLMLIADQQDGFDVALEILYMRLFSDSSSKQEHAPEIIDTGKELLRRATFQGEMEHSAHELTSVVKACLAHPDSASIAAGIVRRLIQSGAVYPSHLYDAAELFTALLELQPIAVLDAVFVGEEDERGVGELLFGQGLNYHRNAANVISCQTLIAWCNADRERRYILAASVITFSYRSEVSKSLEWSDQAKVLFANAPEPKKILTVFIDRFRPRAWSGSRASIVELNARLLDLLEPHFAPDLMPFVTQEKSRLAEEVEAERQSETARDEIRDERFE